jgi:hypothetical protein
VVVVVVVTVLQLERHRSHEAQPLQPQHLAQATNPEPPAPTRQRPKTTTAPTSAYYSPYTGGSPEAMAISGEERRRPLPFFFLSFPSPPF